MENNNLQKLQFDYQVTIDQFKMLQATRFKLLAFVPTLAGAAISFFSGSETPETALAVGLLGFVMTIGILFYDIRNTQFYDATIHRAKCLEALIDFPQCTKCKERGGLFNERKAIKKHRLMWYFEIGHDRGLGLAYGAALGGWTFIIADSSFSLFSQPKFLLALSISVFVGILCSWKYERLSRQKNLRSNDKLENSSTSEMNPS